MTAIERSPSYYPPIPDKIKIEYENNLRKIMRWESGLLTPSIPESDLEHVRDMLIFLEDIKQNCIHIPAEVNFTTTSHMIYIHDAGEILAGDLAHTHPNYSNLKPQVKKKEKAAFRLLTRAIENEATKNLARELYKRCENKSPNDKEAQLTDFIDKAQGVRFGVKYVYPGTDIKNPQRRAIQLNQAASVLLKPAEALVWALESPYSKKEAIELIKKELEIFTSFGYRIKEVQPYLNRVSSFSLNGNHQ